MRARTIAGIVLTLAAFAQMTLAGYLVMGVEDIEARVDAAWEKADDLCRESLGQVGELTASDARVEVRRLVREDEDWRVVMMDASSAISFCTTRQMISFCMGRACALSQAGRTESDFEEQAVSPSFDEILRSEPVRLSFTMMEIRP